MTTVFNLPSAWLPIADAIVKATIVLLLAAGASLVLRRASAALRHLVWTLALCSALVLPVLTFALPKWQLPLFTLADAPRAEPFASSVLDDSPSVVVAPPRRVKASSESAASAPAPTQTEASVPNPAPSWLSQVSWTQALLALWVTGALLIVARIAIGMVAIRLVARRGQAITDAHWIPMARELAAELGVPRVRFLRSGRACMPSATGVFRPAVILPADADAWPESRLRIVLLHELAHVKRRDCLTHLLAQAACAFYWFNPLAWIAVKRARTERERACDDLVLACGTRGSDYADELLEMARALRGDRFPALLSGASLAMAHQSQLEGRLMAILDPRVPRAGLSRPRALVAVALCFVSVSSLGALQPWTTGSDATEQPAANSPRPSTTAPDTQDLDTVLTHVAAATRAASLDSGKAHSAPPRHDVLDGQPPQPPQPMSPVQPEQSRQRAPQPQPMPMPMPVHDASPQVAEAVADAMKLVELDWMVSNAAEKAGDHAWAAQADAGRGRGVPRAQADPRLTAALISALKDSDKEVRETAMHALVKMRDPSIFDPLVQALKDGSPDVREQAAFGLGELRDKRAVPHLIAALKDDTNPSVRERAVFALGQLRDPAAFEGLTVALRDTNADVREQAAFALGQLRDKRAVEPLISALKDTNPSVREHAAFALGQLRDPRAVEALIVATKDTNADVRENVVFALGQLRDPRAIDALTDALKDANADVRKNAAFALGQLIR